MTKAANSTAQATPTPIKVLAPMGDALAAPFALCFWGRTTAPCLIGPCLTAPLTLCFAARPVAPFALLVPFDMLRFPIVFLCFYVARSRDRLAK
jgi:hypothetical protein